MQTYHNFEVDTVNFHNLSDFVSDLNRVDKHWVPIVDAGIAQRLTTTHGIPPYHAYVDGLNRNIFVRASSKEEHTFTPITGRAWPGDVVYPDFINPATQSYWSEWLGRLRQ